MNHESRPPKYDMTSAAFFASPEPTLERMRENDPVYWNPAIQSWVLTRYEDVQFAVRDKSFSVDRGGLIGRGGSDAVQEKLAWCNRFLLQLMVFSDPPRHTRLRALVSKAFTPQVIQMLRGSTEALVAELVDEIRPRGRMDLVADIALPLPALVTGKMLGLPRSKTDNLKRWSFDLFALFGAGIAPDAIIEKAHESLVECKTYFEQVIEERRRAPGADLISQMVLAEAERETLVDDELVALCVTLMAGAYETTTHLITNGVYALLKHPEQLRALKEDPQLVDTAVEEIFRYIGPALSIVRRAKVDVELGGQTIRAGDNVFCMLHAANQDPAYFSAPETMNIRRKENKHLGLGEGIHFCLGAALTRMEARITLQAIVQRFPNLRLDDEEVHWIPNLVMRGMPSLPLSFTALPREPRTSLEASAE